MNKFKENCNYIKLRDVISQLVSGQSPNRKSFPARPNKKGILRTTAIQWSGFEPNENLEALEDFNLGEDAIVRQNDILITKAGPSNRVGVVAISNRNTKNLYVSGKMALIRVKEFVDPHFLAYQLSNKIFQNQLHADITGMAQSQTNITHKNLIDKFIYLPQLSDQKRISEIIKQIDKVKNLHILKKKSEENRSKALLHGFFSNIHDYPLVEISSFGKVITGSTPATSDANNYGGDIPFISPFDLTDRILINDTKTKLTSKGLKNTRSIPSGSICVVCIGSTIGKVAISSKLSATNQQINSICPGNYDSYYLFSALKYYSKTIKKEASHHAVPIINKSKFSCIRIPSPPLQKQIMFGRLINNSYEMVDLLDQKIVSLEKIKLAILNDFFNLGNNKSS